MDFNNPIYRVPYDAANIAAWCGKTPVIDPDTKHWLVWDIAAMDWVDTGIYADGQAAATAAEAAATRAEAAAGNAEALQAAIFGAYPNAQISDASVASFDDGADGIPVKHMTVNITPVQAEGTPTPESPLAISGWTGANITRTGKNLWGGTAARDGIKASLPSAVIDSEDYGGAGTIRFSATANVEKVGYMPEKIFDPMTPYTVILTFNGFSQRHPNSVFEYTDGTTAVLNNAPEANIKYTLVQNSAQEKTVKYVRKTNTGGSTSVYYNETGLFKGIVTAEEFEEYKGTTYAIAFPEAVGTVYGGTLTDNGDGTWTLTVTHANIASYAGESINEPWISSMDVYAAGATPTTGAQVVYPLTTPVSHTLTAGSVKTLLGENTVFADCGDVAALTYRADPTLFIARMIAEATA